MATVGGFSRHHHLDELNSPLQTNSGYMSPAARKAATLANLGLTATAAEINILDGVTATAEEINAAADGSANTTVVDAGGGAITLPTGGGTVLVPLVTANATVTLPVPTVGAKYTFIFIGTATEGSEDWVLTTAATSFFVGGLASLVHGTPDIEPVYANGSTHNTLTINTAAAGTRVDLVGVSATQWAVTGYAVAITAPAFSAV